MAENVELQDNKLVIKNLEIKDGEVVNYLSEKEELESKLKNALKVGVLSLKSGETSQNVDYVEKRFESLNDSLDNQIKDLQQEFEEKVSDKLGENGDLIKEFNPDKTGTPLHSLKTNLEDQLQNLRTDLKVDEGKEELKQKTTLKGDDFEDQLEELLGKMLNITGDELEYTGEKQGQIADSKKGDFVIDLRESSIKIVIEAKDAKYSKPKIKREMEEAIENRGADYGIFVSKRKDKIPAGLGWFKEIEGNFLSLSLTEENQDLDEGSLELLNIGFKWSKIRAMSQKEVNDENVDIDEITQKIESAKDDLNSFQQLKSKSTKIKTRANEIKDLSEEIQSNVEGKLDEIREQIR